jgi:hypothetical protein
MAEVEKASVLARLYATVEKPFKTKGGDAPIPVGESARNPGAPGPRAAARKRCVKIAQRLG